jgi:hypothetical protein
MSHDFHPHDIFCDQVEYGIHMSGIRIHGLHERIAPFLQIHITTSSYDQYRNRASKDEETVRKEAGCARSHVGTHMAPI